jgi:glutathione synthase/RimK-type ligase-like ATP-grasp enzyme
MTVLVLSKASDTHAQAVLEVLARRGAKVELLDLSEFPTRLALSMEFSKKKRRFELARRGSGSLDLSSVKSVWWRRPQPFRLPRMSPTHGEFALSEANTAFRGLWQSLRARWINIPALDSSAAHKPFQLTIAQEIGLEIPETIMTNNSAEAQAFWQRHEGQVIHKQFIAREGTWRETRRVTKDDEAYLASIDHAPVIFQRHIPAVADLRITIVDKTVFAAGADVRNLAYPQDVRVNPAARYETCALPDKIIDRLLKLMQRLGLVYGAIDLRLTPDGRYVFLELNPAGQFLFIEKATGQRISTALSDALLA